MAKKVLVTGPTGYVGGRLIPLLIDEGFKVRVLARHPQRLKDYAWYTDVEIVEGDARDIAIVKEATKKIDIAYYLLHSIVEGKNIEEFERTIANNFAQAAKENDVKRFVYLGGIVNEKVLSPHLSSRKMTGEILRASGVSTIELRAAVIIGSGSASFEMLRYLTERLPIMIAPKWLKNRVQPIAIRDVLRYLIESASVKGEINEHFDIGGPDILTYEEMMQQYAHVARLKSRTIITVPVLTPKLSSHWINLVTPVPRAIAAPLVNSLTSEVIVGEKSIREIIEDPAEGLLPFKRAVKLALNKVMNSDVDTRWSSALNNLAPENTKPNEPKMTDPKWSGGTFYVDERTHTYNGDPKNLWKVIEQIGGSNGWYSFPLAWEIRGLADRLVGGVGMRRGRRDPNVLREGETVDFWRVEKKVDGQMLLLSAEMKLPGKASLLLSIEDSGDEGNKVFHLLANFRPHGLWGHVYWWLIRPFHGIVFEAMLKNMTKQAEIMN